jgi:hypothetical protein
MTRSRLTATEILHGARAYSHNASRRAHQLSGPKRVRVMHGPVGDAARNGTANSLVMRDGGRPLDGACDCGYVVCAQRGPCAPAVQPIPAPPGERDPYEAAGHPWARVGMRVRMIGMTDELAAHGLEHGAVYMLAEPKDRDRRFVMLDRPCAHRDCRPNAGTACGGWRNARFEPAPIAEAPAVESDEAVLRRCGWTGRPGASFLDYHLADGTALWVSQLGASPSWFRSGGDGETHNAPTLLQAACAALGITLKEHSMRGLWAAAGLVGDTHRVIVGFESKCADAESCARAALLAYASRGKP